MVLVILHGEDQLIHQKVKEKGQKKKRRQLHWRRLLKVLFSKLLLYFDLITAV